MGQVQGVLIDNYRHTKLTKKTNNFVIDFDIEVPGQTVIVYAGGELLPIHTPEADIVPVDELSGCWSRAEYDPALPATFFVKRPDSPEPSQVSC